MARRAQRIMALSLAIMFLTSTLAVTGFVLYVMYDENQQSAEITTEEFNDMTTQGSAGSQLTNYEPVDEVDELQIIDLDEGDGAEVTPGATVTVHYTGALANSGVIFESSKDGGEPVTFPLDGVIQGWGEGIPGMKVGGTRRLIIPAEMAYGGQSPSPNIPANSALVFDVELINVE